MDIIIEGEKLLKIDYSTDFGTNIPILNLNFEEEKNFSFRLTKAELEYMKKMIIKICEDFKE